MKKQIEKYFDKLFYINRSITGKGYKDSLKILSKIIPFKILKFKSGLKVFDWKVPLEWNVESAKLIDENNKVILDVDNNNLYLVGYSQKKNVTISKKT